MTNSTINNNNNDDRPEYQDSRGTVETFGLKIGTPGITIDTAIFPLILLKVVACLSLTIFPNEI